MRQLIPRLDNFDGSNPIALLSFLHLIRLAVNALCPSEGAACTIVSWFLDEPAVTVYSAYELSGVCSTIRGMVMCPKVVNVLLERYLDDAVLSESHHRVTFARQRENETEKKFATHIESYAGDYSGVFDEHLVINYFLRGLLPTSAAVVAATV